MVTTAPEQVLTYQGTADWTFTTTAVIPAGRVIVIGYSRTTATSATTGCTAVNVSAGAVTGFRTLGSAIRASTYDLGMVAVQVTTAIPSGATITLVSGSTASGKRGGVLSSWTNVTLPPVEDATSGTASLAQTGGVNSGPNGSSATPTASTTGSMPTGDHVVLGCLSFGGTQTITAGSGYTEVGQVKTVSGTADRGCLLEYANDSTSGVKTATATLSASGGWASAVATLPLSVPASSFPVFKERTSGGTWVTLTAKRWNGTAWETLTVKEY